ncbi:MAG: hypothetical protein IH614_06105 [Desulfuromonadales bacterium]|nr:hypothetical protein [Desulfuromonadales bacterium]
MVSNDQKAGTGAILAIVAAIGSYVLSFSGRPGFGLLAALIALPLGVFGLVRAASPRVSGGIMSIVAIALAIFAIGVAVLGLIGAIIL